jgi:phosphoesterase RecJ-like protein
MKSANMGLAPRQDRHETVLPRVVSALQQAQKILCVMHAGPDGDACGSTLALALSLSEMGKEVTLFCHTDVPYNMKFLKGLERLLHVVPPDAKFDATTVCDVGASHRIGPGFPPRDRLGVLLNIDHHLTSDDFGDVNYVDADAASVGVLVHRILRAMGHPLSKPVAEALYVSVMTDTGSFRYSSTNPEAMRVAADLVEAGADPWTVSSAIYEQQPIERLKLLREVLGTLEVSADGHFASLVVTQAMKAAAHARPELTDGFINFARGIQGVEVASQLTEPVTPNDPWGLSFRSRGRVNVARVAQRFGGGGHHNAAGASLHGTLEEVRARVAEAVAEEMKVSV